MLRRDLRRAQAAVAAAVAQTVEAAATSSMAEAAAETAPAAADTADVAAEEAAAPASAVPSEATPPASEPLDAAPASAEPAPETLPAADEEPASSAGRGRTWRNRDSGPRRGFAAPRPASSPSARPERAARSSRRRIWQMTGAALAVATLVGGTALPALGMVRTGATAVATEASADLRTQSFTASAHVLPEVVVSGSFSATTPDELKEIQAVAAATARSGVSPIAKPGQIIIPMAAGTYTMTDGFGATRPGRSHMGQDYAASIGTPIYAAADGVVTMSQDSYGGYGVTVQIQHDEDGSVSTLYGHMNYGTRAVQVGEHVVAGQFLGRVGNTGYTIGSCLHFEVHINGAPINPVPWLEAHVR